MGINEDKKVLLFTLILINAGAVQYTTFFLSQLFAVRTTSVN